MQLESDKWKNRIVKIDVFLDKKEATQIDIIRQLLFHAGKMPSKALAEQVGLTQNALKDYLADIVWCANPTIRRKVWGCIWTKGSSVKFILR